MTKSNETPPEPPQHDLLLTCADATIEIAATKSDASASNEAGASGNSGGGGGGGGLPKFRMIAYTGDAMRVMGWPHPIVVDLGGLSIPSQRRPIRFAHSAYQGIGHTERIAAENDQLIAEGVISRDTPAAREVVVSGKRGFPWQASIGASVVDSRFVKTGKTVQVNGRTFAGPIYVATKTQLGEISFVDLGADGATSATIAASIPHHLHYKQKERIVMPETDNTTSTTSQETQTVEAASPTAGATAMKASDGHIQEEPGTAFSTDLVASRKQAATELRRQGEIRQICANHTGIAAQAIEEGWSVEKAELAVLRASRPKAPMPGVGPGVTGEYAEGVEHPQVLAAAVCLSVGLSKPEDHFDTQTLEAADQRFRGQIGLQQLLLEAAWANGYAGRTFAADKKSVLQAAFSTMSLPGILSNTANKFLLDSFNAVESAWRSVSATRNVRDFKQVTSYRLTADAQYEQIGPDGELKHAKVGEESYTNQAQTYGKMFSITRTDLINDDLGALADVPKQLGRGGALKLNDVFWTAFLDNTSFFTTGHKNYAEGATTALAIDALTTAEQKYLDQTDPNGHPMAISPAILLVPNGLLVTATQLMHATEVRQDGNTAKTKYLTNNPHMGKFRIVRSSYLSNSRYTGYSTKAWYLLAEPADVPVIEVAFLNGRQEPVVESADADFNTLGIQLRAYHDFGVKLQEYRGGVKFKGEA